MFVKPGSLGAVRANSDKSIGGGFTAALSISLANGAPERAMEGMGWGGKWKCRREGEGKGKVTSARSDAPGASQLVG